MYKRHKALEQAKAALTLVAERMKWYYDKKVQSFSFKVGNKVLLNLKDEVFIWAFGLSRTLY